MLWLVALAASSIVVQRSDGCSGAPADSAAVVLSPRLLRPQGPGLGRGTGWRALWADSVCLPVARVERLDGGLGSFMPEPGALANVVTGRATDGRAFRVLPVDRDPVSASLPPALRGTAFERVRRDLVATVHPTAPLVAAALYRNVGLEAILPALVVLRAAPDSSHLLDGLRDRPVWVERAPELDDKPYGRFAQVITTDRLLAMAREDPTTVIDTRRYLTARLLDVMMGDRDRSPEHWLWGLDSVGQLGRWWPIATRQEEAFLRAQGWSGLVLNQYEPGHQVFGPGMPDVAGLTDRAYDLDRVVLARLDRATWDSVASALERALTNERIEAAVAMLPPSQRRASDSILVAGVVGRRSLLPRIVDQFYRRMTRYPDVELSDASERVTVDRSTSGDVEIRAEAGGAETVRREFRHSETAEVRLHLEGGQDSVLLLGVERGGMGVRITSRSGAVTLVRPGAGTRRVVLYADPDSARQQPPAAVRLVPRARGRHMRWRRDGELPAPPDWGSSTAPVVQLGLNGDLGLVAGAGMQKVWRGFGEPHFRQRLQLAAAFASRPSGVRLQATFERRDVLRNIHLLTRGEVTGIDVVRFFGYGNGTAPTQDRDFYRVEAHEVALGIAAAVSSRPEFVFTVGPFMSLGSTDTAGAATLVALEQPYGSGRFRFGGLEAKLEYAGLRSALSGPHLRTTVEGVIAPALGDLERGGFQRVVGEARLVWGLAGTRGLVVATRLGGILLGGDVPFRLAARIGGPLTLRGFETDRFAGDRGAAYGSLETRVRVLRFRLNFIVGDLGVLAFGDAGRVWSRGETSSKVHAGFGGGLWAAPAIGWLPGIDEVVARLDVAHSEERTIVSLGTGFRF